MWLIIEGFLTSRLGQWFLIAALSAIWATNAANVRCKANMADEKAKIEAAYQAEILRQEQVSRDIAAEATIRAENDANAASAMQKIIDDYGRNQNEKVKVIKSPCVVNDDFLSVMRRIDALGRKASSSHSPYKFR